MELAVGPAAWTRRTRVVVVGTGAAGLSAMLHLAAAGVECIAVTRGEPTDSATAWAQGGLAAVWDDADTLAAHVDDTLVAGAGLCDRAAVEDLVASAPGAIRRLVALGAEFDRAPDGDYDLHLEGGHSHRRILHADDATGAEVERALWAALSRVLGRPGIEVLTHTRLVDVLADADGSACGIRVFDVDGEVGEILADAVVLATGGLGQLWPVTSNPAVATADGLAAALRAGAEARDLEFIQFHPTVLADADAERQGVLISEAVRGEGALLVDASGRRIMAGVHPLAELAPRDVVSAAIMAHVDATGEPTAFLDATAFGAEKWEHSFPGILAACRERGIDPVTQPIPVLPAAHYSCGGIAADMTGRTTVPCLFAVGEVAATGVQGANRLASNSVTEALVTGDRAGELLARGIRRPGAPMPRPQTPLADPAGLPSLKLAMQQHAFVSRTAEGLGSLSFIGRIPTHRPHMALSVENLPMKAGHPELTATNLTLAARAIVAAAAERTESRGCHRRADFPATDPAWARRITVRLVDGHIELGTPAIERSAA